MRGGIGGIACICVQSSSSLRKLSMLLRRVYDASAFLTSISLDLELLEPFSTDHLSDSCPRIQWRLKVRRRSTRTARRARWPQLCSQARNQRGSQATLRVRCRSYCALMRWSLSTTRLAHDYA